MSKKKDENDPWVCDICAEIFELEVDLNAHLFNSYCERELKERLKERKE